MYQNSFLCFGSCVLSHAKAIQCFFTFCLQFRASLEHNLNMNIHWGLSSTQHHTLVLLHITRSRRAWSYWPMVQVPGQEWTAHLLVLKRTHQYPPLSADFADWCSAAHLWGGLRTQCNGPPICPRTRRSRWLVGKQSSANFESFSRAMSVNNRTGPITVVSHHCKARCSDICVAGELLAPG